ncbi:hypothetical protein AG1IA_09035 [Rhizoctonia solani AG-1 IA]|uniref:N-acetyltransferase domain-containing protein n=1 Tax=Thanatephorus cucumeris (strain AG1-IA) TaxID=983506 RepID=L8WG45_THACA|nr:hypothetical protein AG1IA_09035 [Rhizoctonia solani AG-1 IA]
MLKCWDQALRQMYRHFLLRLPSVYFTRVSKVFEEAELSRVEVQKMIDASKRARNRRIRRGRRQAQSESQASQDLDFWPNEREWTTPIVSPSLQRFKQSWDEFMDSLQKEWKTLNVVSALLLSAILTMFQVEGSDEPVMRTAALIALEAQKHTTGIWWNVWVFLSLPSVFLAWSVISFCTAIMAFSWTTGSVTPPSPISDKAAIGPRLGITAVFLLGLVYFYRAVKTLKKYADPLPRHWALHSPTPISALDPSPGTEIPELDLERAEGIALGNVKDAADRAEAEEEAQRDRDTVPMLPKIKVMDYSSVAWLGSRPHVPSRQDLLDATRVICSAPTRPAVLTLGRDRYSAHVRRSYRMLYAHDSRVVSPVLIAIRALEFTIPTHYSSLTLYVGHFVGTLDLGIMSLEDLIVRLANEAQFHEATRRDALYWAGRSGLSVEDYVTLDELLLHGAFEREGKLHIWVFVPKDNSETTDFYASCETLAREVITLQPGQSEPSSSYGHSITSVIVPPEHRRKGYAERFMSLLHSALVPHRYPDPLNTPVTFKQPSTVSVLYSVVGNYYARCVPAARESGWTIQKSQSSSPVESLSDTEIISALDLDDSNIPGDMLKMQKQDPEKTYFAFVPTAPLNDYSVVISKLVMKSRGVAALSWGAKIPGTNNFMAWVFHGLEQVQLVITSSSDC